jgi:hypothetical protein
MFSKFKISLFTSALLSILCFNLSAQTDSTERAGIELFPILSYDTDAGFGYGAKAFFYDQLNTRESFDIILFNSTKGEQWYKFVFSAPDFESRQGTEFPLALDVTFEYDKWKNYNLYYYGWEDESTNSTSQPTEFIDQCVYELAEAKIFLSRAFRKDLTASFGLKFKSINSYDYRRDSTLTSPEEVEDKYMEDPSVKYVSVNLSGKWDTRNSFINPSTGQVLEIELEYAPGVIEGNSSFFRQAFIVRYYKEILLKNLILASRAMEQVLVTSYKSSQFLAIPVGGSNTLRGVPQDKFRFFSEFLLNTELRFPIWWRFGGIVGLDIGYGSNEELYPEGTINWIVDPVIGLRFFMDNFIVRADVGFYQSDIGFYLNFGHIY